MKLSPADRKALRKPMIDALIRADLNDGEASNCILELSYRLPLDHTIPPGFTGWKSDGYSLRYTIEMPDPSMTFYSDDQKQGHWALFGTVPPRLIADLASKGIVPMFRFGNTSPKEDEHNIGRHELLLRIGGWSSGYSVLCDSRTYSTTGYGYVNSMAQPVRVSA